MSWNHRVMAHEYKDEVYFKIHEVYYDVEGVPNSYTVDAISIEGESLKDMKWTLGKMQECLSKPILYAGDKFPKEYKTDKN